MQRDITLLSRLTRSDWAACPLLRVTVAWKSDIFYVAAAFSLAVSTPSRLAAPPSSRAFDIQSQPAPRAVILD